VSPQGWRVTPQFRWVQASFADNDHTLPVDAQNVVDLAASYPFTTSLEGFLHIENLFDKRYVADNSGFNPPLRGTPFSAFVGARLQLR
jgi:outer membrane receptor protein involved in Fe transport